MSQALLNELAQLHKSKQYRVFHEKSHNLFGGQLEKENFIKWLAELNIIESQDSSSW